MTSRMLVMIAVLVGSLPACGRSDADSEPGGEGDESGGADAGPDERDFEVLSSCLGGSCEVQGYAQLIEAGFRNIHRDSVSCVLSALRDRSAGRYAHETNSTFSNGGVGAHHVIVGFDDGTATYARQRYGTPGFASYDPEPGQRCVLKPPSYFDDCLAALETTSAHLDDEGWRCAFGDGGTTTPSSLEWFESCESESPASCP